MMKETMIYPRGLRPGDQVCLIDPANAFTAQAVAEVSQILEREGYKVVVSEDMAFKRGTPQERARKLNQVLQNPDNRGIFCIWGGYGTMTLLDLIDYDSLRRNRPVFTGFSDITAMHLAIEKRAGLVTFHAPSLFSASRPTTEAAKSCLLKMVREPSAEREFCNLNGEPIEMVRSGCCRGQVVGGNLTLVSRLMGTPYEIDVEGRILFLEEIGEKPYRLHGMMSQLKLSGKLSRAAGVMIGALTDCDDKGRPGSGLEAVKDVLKDVDVPVVCNFRAGHIGDALTLPLFAELRIEDGRVYQVRG